MGQKNWAVVFGTVKNWKWHWGYSWFRKDLQKNIVQCTSGDPMPLSIRMPYLFLHCIKVTCPRRQFFPPFFWQWRRWRLQHKQVDCTINFFEKDITMLVNALWMFRPRSVPFLFRTSGKVKLARLMNMIWKTNWSLELIDDNCLQFFLQWRWWRLQHKQVYGTINCFNGFMMLVNALWMLWKMNW